MPGRRVCSGFFCCIFEKEQNKKRIARNAGDPLLSFAADAAHAGFVLFYDKVDKSSFHDDTFHDLFVPEDLRKRFVCEGDTSDLLVGSV